ncbi:MAG TPA: chromosome segregation protein SMC [Verrucomicrobiota bacterium]|nr:chromosome segregation protein SMC [Verrucomicrobiota bacterium]HNU50866.1 chromosome segregation protein SMC [Verrucomicrobiota bacterium]
MHLKSLTALGFKSFADKTTLTFQPGITAIVGPNGCGKSNIADAIRWVLGEQSAKALRGGEMADVIFTGSDGRHSMSFAEVSLTLDGVAEDHLRAAGVDLAFEEVTITRRVFRDGGSEYFINKTPCRLKDIQQLFAGTGVGRTSYSIMAQGNITQILSSRPEDRRMVFEEAAGITRFKAQKKEALRKLEITEQNLLRIEDLIREVKRQIISLQRQAGKARRFKQCQTELQYLETQLCRHQFDLLEQEIAARQSRVEHLRAEMEASTAEVVHGEDAVAQLRQRLTDLDLEISAARQRDLQLQNESERHEHRIQHNEQRLAELAEEEQRAHREKGEADQQRTLAEQELAALSEQLEASAAHLATLKRDLDQRRRSLAQLESELAAAQETARRCQSQLLGSAQQLSRTRNEINALDLQKQGNAVRLEKLSTEKVQLEEERARLETRLTEFARESELEQQSLANRRLGVEECQQRLRALHQDLDAVGQELDALQRRQAALRSRLTVLEQLEASHEGYGAGAVAALRNTQHVLGTLADRIRVPAEHVPAIEAILGLHLQLVLTEAPDSARAILEDLAARHTGRASIASLALRREAAAPAEPPVSPEIEERLRGLGCLPALTVLHAEESVAALIGGLLGPTRLAPNLAAATEGWRLSAGALDFVTPKGEILSRHGVFTGGSTNGNGPAPSSILARKNEIAELQSTLTGLQEQVQAQSVHKGALQSEQTALQARLQQEQSDLRSQEVAVATRQGEFNALQSALKSLHQKIDTVVYEVQCLAAQEQEGLERRTALAAELSRQETEEQTLQRRLADQTAALESARQQRDQLNGAVTESKVAAASEEQRNAALLQRRQPLEDRIRELRQRADQRAHDCSTLQQRQEQARAEMVESRLRNQQLRIERDQLDTQVAALSDRRQTEAAEIATRDEALRARRRQLTALQEQRAALDVELAQHQMMRQNLLDRIQQKYQIRLEDVRSECITITLAAEGPPKISRLTPEEMATAGVATDWTAVAGQVAALQQKIDEMGPVNLVAIEEYEETEQRHAFLTTQHDDLVKARAHLIEVINKVNTQTREMFTETFRLIRENFRALFVEIFRGGKADLQLIDEGDVLESGIEIVARPPGKQLQSISLLSGGEQTMTAVALLFAIYQVRPSPFCVLDELDAPLDESNISCFVTMLQRFLAHSQFVIITHSKSTIAMADVLYGITMQERGVSKIVSVKFRNADEAAPAASSENTTPAPDSKTLEEKPEERLELAPAP